MTIPASTAAHSFKRLGPTEEIPVRIASVMPAPSVRLFCFVLLCFEKGPLYIALAVLELTL